MPHCDDRASWIVSAFVAGDSDDEPFDDLDVPDDPLADLDRATQQLTVQTEERRYGKEMVIIEGF